MAAEANRIPILRASSPFCGERIWRPTRLVFLPIAFCTLFIPYFYPQEMLSARRAVEAAQWSDKATRALDLPASSLT